MPTIVAAILAPVKNFNYNWLMKITAKNEALEKARDAIQLKSLDLGLNWRQSRKLDRLVFELFGLAEYGEVVAGFRTSC